MALPTITVTPGSGATINTLPNAPAVTANSVSVALASDHVALPLPTGAATAANQSSQLTQETSTATALGAPADAAWVSGNGTAIALLKKIAGAGTVSAALGAFVDGAIVSIGALADAAWTTGNGSVIALLKAIAGKQDTLLTALGSPMQATGGTVSTAANISGGSSVYAAVGGTGNALLTNTKIAVKASAGNIYGVMFLNKGGADAYVQIFNALSAGVTLGTTPPLLSVWVPPGGAWEEKFTGEAKLSLGTGITVAATTTSTGSTAPATGIHAHIYFK